MSISKAAALAGAAVVAALCAPAGAWAASEEIQVYMDEMGQQGQFGLDVHTNYVLSGDRTPSYLGEQPSVHRLRVTPEWAYAVKPWLELGAYLPLATVDNTGKVGIDGAKMRVKFVPTRPADQHWFWGLNFELGRVEHKLDQNPWNAELKTILGTRTGRWTFAVNGNFDWTVSGPKPSPATFDLSTKVSYALTSNTSIGVESYNGFGEFRNLGHLGSAGHETYAVVDTTLPHGFDLNLGLGRGYSGNNEGWIVKAIIGVPIDPRP